MTKKIIVEIDDKLNDELRVAIYKKYGLHQGVIRKACIEALQDWLRRNK